MIWFFLFQDFKFTRVPKGLHREGVPGPCTLCGI